MLLVSGCCCCCLMHLWWMVFVSFFLFVPCDAIFSASAHVLNFGFPSEVFLIFLIRCSFDFHCNTARQDHL
ncbi:hypothetical protein BDZ97DRAFT_1844707 [Flammula alnicola]|nr:hypothetical protein BDZ97DRAFT_1844707 [Flammula alnicola]